MGMPILIGIGNYLVPLMIGARDMAFPRLNAFGFWVTFFGGLLAYFSFAVGGAPAIGWFAYAPLTEPAFTRGLGTEFWCLGLLVSGIGTITAAVNFFKPARAWLDSVWFILPPIADDAPRTNGMFVG